MMMTQVLNGFLLSSLITMVALRRGSLSPSGGVGALIVGTMTFGFGGWAWGSLLGVFFVTSSLLSHFKEEEKAAVAEKFDKGHERDLGQALANGGVGSAAALLAVVWPEGWWYAFFIGVMGTVNADTWATELGTLSRRRPRLITTGKQVEVGTSGGISVLGTVVSLVGGAVIGLFGGWLGPYGLVAGVVMGAVGGLAGSLFDSLLGATVQANYYCEACGKETEKVVHGCGTATRQVRGWVWLNNDMVNLAASVVGGLVAVGVWGVWG
ncbi:MAG TPA: DUF92 domain-containing protein [Anaerolineae bacterium]|nr:DUF92 domain-containing protein [Anaerolineae bacterium]